MSIFTVNGDFLIDKKVNHLRFLDRTQYEQLQQQLGTRCARIVPDPPFSCDERCDLYDVKLVCRNENINPADVLAVCLRALL